MSTEVVHETKILLTPNNYALWLLPIKAKLHKLKALQVVNGSVHCPDPKKDKANAQLYVKLNEDGYAKIVQHLSQEVLAYVSTTLPESSEFNGQALWTLLKTKYARNDFTSRTTALKKYLSVDYASFTSFLASIRSANQKIVVSGLAIDDQFKVILMLDKLPSEFHSFKTNIAMNFETKPFENVLKNLEDYASQNHLSNFKKLEVPAATMFTSSNNPEITCPHCKRGFKACSHCLKSSHTEDNCYKKYPNKSHPKTPAASSKHLTHLTQYTKEDRETLEYLQQKYPLLHM
jgi:hypothetical protein